MAGYKGNDFNDRATSAAAAKRALVEKFKAQPSPDDPAVIERQQAQLAIVAAREARAAEREVLRQVELARQAELAKIAAAEQAAREAEEVARLAEVAAEAVRAKLREAALEAERKAARDARYAARKARR